MNIDHNYGFVAFSKWPKTKWNNKNGAINWYEIERDKEKLDLYWKEEEGKKRRRKPKTLKKLNKQRKWWQYEDDSSVQILLNNI